MRPVFGLGEGPPHRRLDAQNVEVVGRHAPVVEVLHVRVRLQVHAGGPSGDGGDQRRHVIPQQLPLLAVQVDPLIEGVGAGDAPKERPHPLRLRVGQALEHQGVHHGKNGGVGADGKRQRADHCECEPGITIQLTHTVARVPPQSFQASTRAPVAHGLLYLLHAPKLCHGGPPGLGSRDAGGNFFVDDHAHVRSKLPV